MIVLDASALLALIFRERGCEKVARVLGDSAASTVNLAEVLGVFTRRGKNIDALSEALLALPVRWLDFDGEQARLVAELLPLTKKCGLSLGDRACLALALARGIPAMTADRAWERVPLDVTLEIIR